MGLCGLVKGGCRVPNALPQRPPRAHHAPLLKVKHRVRFREVFVNYYQTSARRITFIYISYTSFIQISVVLGVLAVLVEE